MKNDQSRVGKDNYFWNEIEIRNLPTSSYLVSVFFEALEVSNAFDSVYGDFSCIGLDYNKHSGWSGAYGRREIEMQPDVILNIKDLLKWNCKACYNEESHVLEMLKLSKKA